MTLEDEIKKLKAELERLNIERQNNKTVNDARIAHYENLLLKKDVIIEYLEDKNV